jgi:hypothetical protein
MTGRLYKSLSSAPLGSDRLGWHKHYAKRFNKTGSKQAEHLALWYLVLHIAFDIGETT